MFEVDSECDLEIGVGGRSMVLQISPSCEAGGNIIVPFCPPLENLGYLG